MSRCAGRSKSVPTLSYAMRASASAPGATGSPATHAISGRHARSGASRGRRSAFSSILLQACTHTCRMAKPLGIFPVWFALSLPPATTFDSANLHNPKPNPSSASYTLPPSVLRQSAAPVAAPRPSPSPPHRPWRGSAMTRGSALTPVLVRARGVGLGVRFRSRVW